MSNINISLSEVSDMASRIRNVNQMMYDSLVQMKNDMNSLNGTWVSDGSEEIRNHFNQFATRFEKQKEVIEQYAAFLDLTVSSYDSLESTITSNASSLQY